MVTKFKYPVRARMDLDGTHECCVLTTDDALFDRLQGRRGEPLFFTVTAGSKSCGVVVDRTEPSNQDILEMDTLKLKHLGVRDGDLVELEVFQPPQAAEVTLLVAPETTPPDLTRLIGKLLSEGEETAIFSFAGEPCPIRVGTTGPRGGIVRVTRETRLRSESAAVSGGRESYATIGGLGPELRQIREIIEYPLRFPEAFERLGIRQPKGIILFGPPGTGKTLIIKALAAEVGAAIFQISGPEIFNKYVGESERHLREIFQEARTKAPALIVIDELDSLAPARDRMHGEVESRVVATLLTLMDGIHTAPNVVVVGTTNRLDAIDTALRREGRFGTELRIGAPDLTGRRQILEIQTRRMPVGQDVDLDLLAEMTSGFVGADLAQLCREAAYVTLRERSQGKDIREVLNADLMSLIIEQRHFRTARKTVRPSALREFAVEFPKDGWDSVVGLEEVVSRLKGFVTEVCEMHRPLRELGITPMNGVCLHGPAGTGKTLLARAMAAQAKAAFICIRCSDIIGRSAAECERFVHAVFAKAREAVPSVILFEDIDAIGSLPGHGLSTLVALKIASEMETLAATPLIFVGAARELAMVDPVFLSRRCLPLQLVVAAPNQSSRVKLFTRFLSSRNKLADVDVVRLGALSSGLCGADILLACDRAVAAALCEASYRTEDVVLQYAHLEVSVSELQRAKAEVGRHDDSGRGIDSSDFLATIASILGHAAAEERSRPAGDVE